MVLSRKMVVVMGGVVAIMGVTHTPAHLGQLLVLHDRPFKILEHENESTCLNRI